MTPSQQAKELGLESLTQVSRMTGVPRSTLNGWFTGKPDLFKIVLIGCKELEGMTVSGTPKATHGSIN